MSKKIIALTAVLLLLHPGLTGAGQDLQSEERRVPAFTGISVAVPGEVSLIQGSTHRLLVEGTGRVLENLITEVRGGQLYIRMPNSFRFRRYDVLKVFVTMPEIRNITLSGSGRVNAEGPVRLEKASITISGSGRVNIDDISAGELSTTISGSGRLNLGGRHNVQNHRIVISGSGRIESASLPVEKIDATISGSGSCRVHVIGDLNVRISGSGRVIYTGNPLVDARISGSGRVINDN